MSKPVTISVSELKNKLLEIVREVETGKSFSITKGNRPVAQLGPIRESRPLPTGLAKIKVLENIEEPIASEWTLDSENLRQKK